MQLTLVDCCTSAFDKFSILAAVERQICLEGGDRLMVGLCEKVTVFVLDEEVVLRGILGVLRSVHPKKGGHQVSLFEHIL